MVSSDWPPDKQSRRARGGLSPDQSGFSQQALRARDNRMSPIA
jgi:hypothetical protein